MNAEVASTVVWLVLGAVIASIGFLVKSHFEQKAKLKEALFSLIELYRLLMLVTGLNIRRAISAIYEELEYQLPGEGGEEIAKMYRPLINKMINQIFSDQWDSFDQTIGAMFSSTCLRVASVDPMLAARIYGAQYLKGCVPAIQSYAEDVKIIVAESYDQPAVDATERINSIVQAHISEKYVEKLRKDLLQLAWKCGLYTFTRCYLKIRRHKKYPVQGQYEKLMREWVQEIVRAGGDTK